MPQQVAVRRETRNLQIIRMLAAGYSVKEISEKVNLGVNRMYVILKTPLFLSAYKEYVSKIDSKMVDATISDMTGDPARSVARLTLLPKALSVIEEVMDSPDERIRLSAADRAIDVARHGQQTLKTGGTNIAVAASAENMVLNISNEHYDAILKAAKRTADVKEQRDSPEGTVVE